MYRKFVFLVIFDHFHFHNPLKSPLYQQQSTCKGSYSPKSLHKLVLPETVFISYFYEVEMYLMYPEVVYLVFLVILSPPPNPFKVPLYYQWSTSKGSYSVKSLHKLVLSETVIISYFYEYRLKIFWNVQNVPKSRISGHFGQFLPPNPLKSPLLHQWSTSKGTCPPKSPHKLVLPETVFISYFCEVEMCKMYLRSYFWSFQQFSAR